jgi:hypothetical protein
MGGGEGAASLASFRAGRCERAAPALELAGARSRGRATRALVPVGGGEGGADTAGGRSGPVLLLRALPIIAPRLTLSPSSSSSIPQVPMDAWDEGVPATALREISVLKEVRGGGRGREGQGQQGEGEGGTSVLHPASRRREQRA